jgi:hypothetical protein
VLEISDRGDQLDVLIESQCTIDRMRGITHSPQRGYYVAVPEFGIVLGLPLTKADRERGENWLGRLDANLVYIQSRHYENHVSLQVVRYFEQLWEAEAYTISHELSVFRGFDGRLVSIHD